MLPKIFSSIMAVAIQITSTLQVMKQWNLYFSLLIYFTRRVSVNSFSVILRMWRGGTQKGHQLVSPNTFWLLTRCCNISDPYLVPVLSYWTWTKTTLQNWFFWSNPYENSRVTKIWSHDHIYYIIWASC